jgi:hypothetical protein
MRRLATIRQISGIKPIPGADRIVVAQIDGWECVVKKDEFNDGEMVVYVEVDSIMPERPEFEFLRERKFRVKTIRLRQQISQGLVLPLSILPDGHYKLDDDVTDIIGVRKHDPQADQERLLTAQNKSSDGHGCLYKWLLRFKWFRKLFAKPKRKGGFPDWIVKTDEERIQNKTAMFEIEKNLGTLFTATEKLDGQSATYFLRKFGKKYEFGVCSRNIRLDKPDESSYWSIALRHHIEGILKQIIGDEKYVVLQGEIIGPGIQKNKYQLDVYDFYAFNLIYPEGKIDTRDIPACIGRFGIKTVPLIYNSTALKESVSAMVNDAKGNSLLLSTQKREGLVWRSYERNISFKVINPEFLLVSDE